MRKLYIFLAVVLQNFFSLAQVTFQNGYGDTIADRGKVIIATSTGGYCIVGPSGQNNTDSTDIAVYMINNVGDLILSVKIGLPGDEIPTGVVETDNGDFIIAGTTHASLLDTVNTDIFALRITALSGFVIWSKVYGGAGNDEANSILRTPDGFYLILGSTTSFDSSAKSALVMNIKESGDQQWCSITRALNNNYFNRGDITFDNNYILGGGSYDSTGIDNYIVKMDSVGSVIWSKRFGTSGTDWINDIKSTSDSGFVIAGISTVATAGDTDQTVIKLDSIGNVIWANNYGTALSDISTSILPVQFGNFIVCGYSAVVGPGSTLNQMVINEIDNSGNIVWANSYGSLTDACEGYNLAYGVDGGLAASGYSVGFNEPNGDVLLVKIDNNGSSGCFEFPITLILHPAIYTDSSGSSQQIVIPADTFFTQINNDYTNQFTQNCFYDYISVAECKKIVTIYPNPGEHQLNIETEFENADVKIFDYQGKKILEYSLSSAIASINISNLVPGIYFIEVRSGSDFSVKKFIKE